MEQNVKMVYDQMSAVYNDDVTPQPVKDWLAGLLHKLQEAPEKDPRFVKGTVIPASLGALADEYAVVREERLRIEKEAKAVKEREMELFNSALSTLEESADTGAVGENYSVQRVEKEVRGVEDWPTLWAYIRENNAFELLGKSINQKAVREQQEAGEKLPGIKTDTVATLSFRKVQK